MAADSPYRDSQGRFIPKYMPAAEANDKGLGDKYKVSDNYKGKPDNAIAKRIGENPYEKTGEDTAHPSHTHTGHKPNMTTAAEKFGK